jgi:hypothetical protein
MIAPAAPTSEICTHPVGFRDKGATRRITSGRKLQWLSDTLERRDRYLSLDQKRTNVPVAQLSPFHEPSSRKLFGEKQQIVL